MSRPSLPGFDRNLIRKYDGAGPRYTSYPSAPHFQESFGAAEQAALLAASGRSGMAMAFDAYLQAQPETQYSRTV